MTGQSGLAADLSKESRARTAHGTYGASSVPTTITDDQMVSPSKQIGESAVPDQIIVTGSRILGTAGRAPAPVIVLGSEEIEARAPANIADLVDQLPALLGSDKAATNSGSLSNGLAGIDSINLRGLGAGRTLVLLDGQRSVASSITGVVDINTFPQDLIQRVEVVTGGASAQYGSDAIGGVVNFVLRKNHNGVKLSAQQGVSSQGDGFNSKITASAGWSSADGRLHGLLDVEYFRQEPINSIDREWNRSGHFLIGNPAYTPTNGQPQYLVSSGVGPATYTSGGLITSGALRGTYFLGDGVTGKLNYGAFNSVSSPWMVGGDWQTTLAGHVGTNSLLPAERRIGVFSRESFNVTPTLQIFGQFSWNQYHGTSNYQQTPSTGVTIQPDNAFLVSQYPSVAAALGGSSFVMGTSNAGFPIPGSDNTRDVYRYVLGASGSVMILKGRSWSWNAYYQHGVVTAHEALRNTWNLQRMALAQDAVLVTPANVGSSGLPVGSIACRSTLTNPRNACTPIDRLGTNGPSAQSLSYIFGQQPFRDETIKQDVVSATASGDLFNLAGGPAQFAIGGEHRKESISGDVPSQFQPTRNANGTTTKNWLYGNYQPSFGQYFVTEGFVELSLPIIRGVDLDAAGRYTDYSTSGSVQTWKIGGTYSPINGIKLRGTYSHDIRAPNLSELFASGTARTNSVIVPANSGLAPGASQFLETTVGNPDLKPERANTWTAGVVLTPGFASGLRASFDYYDIRIRDVVGTVDSQSTVDYCFSGIKSYCKGIVISDGSISEIILGPVNFLSQKEQGFDIDLSYNLPLSRIISRLPGSLSVHGNVTHYIRNVVDDGVFPFDSAGVNDGGQPSWVYRVSAMYNVQHIALNLVARGFSSGSYSNYYVQCSAGCPAISDSDGLATINDNHIPGTLYIDGSISTRVNTLGREMTLTFIVNNMFNRSPVLVGNGPSGNQVPAYAQTIPQLYDVVGRVFRFAASVRF